ncbi:MAG: relaxase/mobilization nuclease domain-containing protein [Tannerellaceae bacterium]|nr:relaxase/mobilization nuclease domain-containing protein [Tannerellaceae bacterium]
MDVRTKKPFIHISLNPHPDDVLSENQISEIAQEYMEKMGYANQPYIVYKHEDIERHHIHIVSLRVKEDGKKINDSFEYKRSKKVTEEIEQKFGLNPADKKQFVLNIPSWKVDYNAGNVKHQISNTVKGVLQDYQFQSFSELKTLLSLFNVHAEELKGIFHDRPYHGIIYSATDDNNVKKGNPIKSSRLGQFAGLRSIENKILYSSEKWKDDKLKNKIKPKLQQALNGTTSLEQFISNLKQKNVDVILRENTEGRITGVTFVDNQYKAVFKGSRIGKEFSANNVNNLFRGQPTNGRTTKQEVKREQISRSVEQFSPKESIFHSPQKTFTEFLPNLYSNPEEDKTPELKKKRKRKKGKQY